MARVGIIGAGITGLSAAWRLQSAGYDVVVFESSQHVGGAIKTIEQDGYMVECGPSTLLDLSEDITGLISELGLTASVRNTSPSAKAKYLLRKGRPVAVPSSIPGFLFTPLFSLSAKLSILREPFVPRNHDVAFDEPLAVFVRRRLGAEYLNHAIDALVGGIYAGDPEQLSVKYAFPALHMIEQRYGSMILGQFLGAKERAKRKVRSRQNAPKLSFSGGLSALPEAIATKLAHRLRRGHLVTAAERTDKGWTVRSSSADTLFEEHFDRVLFTAPAHTLAAFSLRTDRPIDTSVGSQISYPPIAAVSLGFRREDVSHPLDGFGVLIPSIERRFSLGTIFATSLFPGRAPEGHVLLSSYVGGARNPANALMEPGEIAERTADDLCSFLGIRGRPAFQYVTKYKRSIPQYNVGFGEILKRFESIEREAPGFYIAGNFRNGISLADSLLSGLSVAKRIAEDLPLSAQ